jgi:HD-GYP domain-containing protein (c-di-GMP phosphodiesterase class II)
LRLSSENTMPSAESGASKTTCELTPFLGKLASCRYAAGVRFLPEPQRLTLIVSGQLEGGLGEGVPLAARPCVPATPLELWQITGSQAVLSELRRFATQLLHKDRATAAHSARVGQLSRQIGLRLGLAPAHLERLSLAAYLHDLGKLKLPLGLLQSSQRLSVAQWQRMKAHPVAGRQLLSGTPLEELGFILEQHHERLDGSGYPHGLKGDELSLEASVVAVADTFDAITHARPYQDARSAQHALSEINRYGDVLYPSAVVSALNRVVRSVQD